MKVIDVIRVTGRGWVVVCDEDEDLINFKREYPILQVGDKSTPNMLII